MREPSCRVDVPAEGGARLATFVFSPDGIRDAPGTPFAVDRSRPPVLMLHGNSESHLTLMGLIGPVSRSRTVIAPDMRAQGASTHGDLPLSYELMARDAIMVLNRLGVPRAHVLGFSDGGIEALLMARDAPHRVRSLLCLGANLTPEGLLPEAREWVEHEVESAEASLAQARSPRVSRRAEVVSELNRLMLEHPHIDASSLTSIDCPTCVMRAEDDIVDEGETRAIALAIRGARLVQVPDAGHDLPRDAPEPVLEALGGLTAGDDARRPLSPADVPADVVVVPLPATDAWADESVRLYGRVLDSLEGPHPDVCGWRRGAWPVPDDIRQRVMAGRTWAAFAIRDVEDGTPRAGARPLGAVTLDHDLAIEDTLDDVPDWDELSPENVLVPHLLAVEIGRASCRERV